MKMAKIVLSKGLENCRKSGKSQGILKRILSGNPDLGSLIAKADEKSRQHLPNMNCGKMV